MVNAGNADSVGQTAATAAPGPGSRTLGRGIAVLYALAGSPEGATVAALAETTGLDRAVLYRLLGTLTDSGFVVRDAGTRRYRLGAALIELGAAAADGLEVRRHARPKMRALVEQVREMVCLAVRDRSDIVIVDRFNPPGPKLKIGYHVGVRHPLDVGALGRALLDAHNGVGPDADTPADRARGFTIVTGDVVSVAAPIYSADGQGVASVGVVAPAQRIQDPTVLGPPVRSLSREVSRALGFDVPDPPAATSALRRRSART